MASRISHWLSNYLAKIEAHISQNNAVRSIQFSKVDRLANYGIWDEVHSQSGSQTQILSRGLFIIGCFISETV